ncbi:MAG: YihY family inner membrane protein [Pseudomonadales bacterium]
MLKVRNFFKSLWRFADQLMGNYVSDGCQSTAAALTYQTLFAVVPLLTVTYSMFNAFEAFDGVAVMVEEFLFTNIVPENVGVVQQYLSSFSAQARSLSVPSTLLLAITAFLMLMTIEKTFNEIWRVREPRRGFQRFLMYWAILTLGPILIGVGFIISTYLVSLPLLSDVSKTTGTLQYVPTLLSIFLFTLLYVAVPNCTVRIRYAVIGAFCVALGFEMAKGLFTSIVARSNFEVVYGTFAAVPLFLLWIYLSWTIVLIGAELVKGLSVFRFGGDDRVESPMAQLLLILEQFYLAHKRGEIVWEDNIRELSLRIDVSQWNDYKAILMGLNLIKPLAKGGLVLSRDLKEVSLWDLYRSVPFDMPQQMGGDKSWEHNLTERLYKISDRSMEYLKLDLESLFQLDEPDVPAPIEQEESA